MARRAGLRYVSDEQPGIHRKRHGKGFSYVNSRGTAISDLRMLQRIHELAIPPAWTDVWICPLPNGHIQATGRDQRRRKQYRYHPRWSELSNRTKFDRMQIFGQKLPQLRRQVKRDLRTHGLNRAKIIAAAIEILDRTLIRVGNREYAESNGSFGVTTLKKQHVEVEGGRIHFRFRAKSNKICETTLRDRKLAQLVQRCEEIPGQKLFQYRGDSGKWQTITSSDINAYLQAATGERFTAKDFRTWRGTAIAAGLLRAKMKDKNRIRKRTVQEVIKQTAEGLGNTAAVCRKFYVNPQILELFESSCITDHLRDFRSRKSSPLDEDEQLLAALLKRSA